ncbi:GxxExxY protein [Alkalicella caledoniensis]|uniref:GxxExxY protein n=1 Tax=Alkalicella caledoniensis TaxID=2731377 RepID=A0A7G9WCY4_ALKCA|nr:GxxExxY protein [Alkalicella caledoniensis]QNO16546.1 GxxExxY protein [Alkalicella caledoniensis]
MLHKEITGKIIRAATEVYNELGFGYYEKIYENALAYELSQMDLNCEFQRELLVNYKGKVNLGKFVADLIVDNKVVVELKSGSTRAEFHIPQILNYMKAANIQVGLIIIFGREKVFYKRVII